MSSPRPGLRPVVLDHDEALPLLDRITTIRGAALAELGYKQRVCQGYRFNSNADPDTMAKAIEVAYLSLGLAYEWVTWPEAERRYAEWMNRSNPRHSLTG